jgi:predicted transcriptional regulator of viral defense system
VVLSHSTALAVYGISDANPHLIHLTVPKLARLRRQKPKSVVLHRADLPPEDVSIHEGIPLTTIGRTVADLLNSGARVDLVHQAISGARREGFIRDAEAKRLRRKVEAHIASLRGRTPPPSGLHG